jgi:glycosyltransferase involved in cell wall biosynthesis
VAIVTPVFNGADYILRTLLATQHAASNTTKITIHHYIADANSADGTSDIIADFEANNKLENYQISHVIEPDNGMYDGIAKGFKHALKLDANIYCYLNAGDYFSPQVFNIVDEILSGDVDWLTGLNVIYNEKSELIDATLPFKYDNRLLLRGFYGTQLPFIQQESTFWSSRAMKLLDLSALAKYKLAGDYFIWHTFAKERLELTIVNVWLGGFSITSGQLSELYYDEYLEEFSCIRDSRSPVDFYKVLVTKICWYLPSKFKLKLNSKIITR